jgi:hypothetical protein
MSMGEAKRPRSGVKNAPKISADRLRKLLLLAKADASNELDLPDLLQYEGMASSDEEPEKMPFQNSKIGISKLNHGTEQLINRDEQENNLNFEFSFVSTGTTHLQLDDDGNEKNSILSHSPKPRLSLGISDGASLLLSIEEEEEYEDEDDKNDYSENAGVKRRTSSIGKSSINAPSSKFKLNDDGVSEHVSDDATKHKNLRISLISAGPQESLGFSIDDSEEKNTASMKKKKVSFGGINLDAGYESPSYEYEDRSLPKVSSDKKNVHDADNLSIKNYETERNEMDAVAAALISSPEQHDYGMDDEDVDDFNLEDLRNSPNHPVISSSRNSSLKSKAASKRGNSTKHKSPQSRKQLFVESDQDEIVSDVADDNEEDAEESAYSEFRPLSNISDRDEADSLSSEQSEEETAAESPRPVKNKKRRTSMSSLASVTSPSFDGKKYKRKPGRETMFLVQKAQQVHAVLDSPDQDDGVRRSYRQRTKPLKFWKNERVIYHTTNDGLGAIMPVPCEEVRRSDSEDEHPLAKRTVKKTTQKKVLKDYVSDLARVTDGLITLKDSKGRSSELSVGATEGMINYQSIESESSKPSESSESDVRAAKYFETESFTNGMVVIPASCTKKSEVVITPEVFFVRSCPEEGIIVTMNGQKQEFGAGDSFWIPSGVEYSVENLSEKREVQLFFVVTYSGENSEVKPKKKRKSSTFTHTSAR